MKYISTIEDREYVIEILDRDHVIVNGVSHQVDFESVSGQPLYSLLLDGHSYEAYVYSDDPGWEVLLHGSLYPVEVVDEREKRLLAASGKESFQDGELYLKAPMPGLVVTISVLEGQTVEKGDVLVILESMKMQNELKAPRAGTISRLRVEVGDRVEQKQTLLSVT
jgi:acetyl/propionyl-CoA carboxylase alpha subunit